MPPLPSEGIVPQGPDRYAETIRYWAGETLNPSAGNAAYYRNPENSYHCKYLTH
jgi:hypothetical protein